MSDPVPAGFVTVTEASKRTGTRLAAHGKWADWEGAMGSLWAALLSGDLPVFVRDPQTAELFRVPPDDISTAYRHWQVSFLLRGKIRVASYHQIYPLNDRRPIVQERDLEQWLGTSDSKSPVSGTGFPGRPQKSKDIIQAEFQRRRAAGEIEVSRIGQARALLDWLREHHPDMPCPKEKTVSNSLPAGVFVSQSHRPKT